MYLISLFWIGPQPELTPRKIMFRWTENWYQTENFFFMKPLAVWVIVDDVPYVVFVFLCLALYHYVNVHVPPTTYYLRTTTPTPRYH
jgi:hypothetical protein